MSKNVGTLISAAIRPVDSDDPIASAYAKEIKGGLHTTDNVSDRNAIIFERREWGMMCYSVADNKTYQLTYNYTSTSLSVLHDVVSPSEDKLTHTHAQARTCTNTHLHTRTRICHLLVQVIIGVSCLEQSFTDFLFQPNWEELRLAKDILRGSR